jgi:hypothetical protein
MRTFSKLVVLGIVVVVLFAGAEVVGAGGEMGKEVTLTGEILDMFCFMKHPDAGQGPEHAKCAQSCINKGLPIGFITEDGTVYLLIGNDHESAADMVVDFAGKQSVLKGTLVEHHGVKAIEIASIRPASHH